MSGRFLYECCEYVEQSVSQSVVHACMHALSDCQCLGFCRPGGAAQEESEIQNSAICLTISTLLLIRLSISNLNTSTTSSLFLFFFILIGLEEGPAIGKESLVHGPGPFSTLSSRCRSTLLSRENKSTLSVSLSTIVAIRFYFLIFKIEFFLISTNFLITLYLFLIDSLKPQNWKPESI